MRLILLVMAVSGCGSVKATAPDAGPIATTPPDAKVRPDALGPHDAMAQPDAGLPSCSSMVTTKTPPSWLIQGDFQQVPDPAGGSEMAWRATQAPFSASFNVPYHVGDIILALTLPVYGDNNSNEAGFKNIQVFYKQDGSNQQNLVSSQAVNLDAQWGTVILSGNGFGFPPFVLATGKLWVQVDVTEAGYYIGDVTAKFGHACQ